MAASRLPSEIGPVIVMGVSGSGKSVIGEGIARALDIPFIEGDRLHPDANVAKMSAGIPLTDDDRWPWLDAVGRELAAKARAGRGAVAGCSALKRAYRDQLRAQAGPGLRFVFLHASREVLSERMSARTGHFMPTSLLDSQLATLESPEGEPGVLTLDVRSDPRDLVARAVDWLGQTVVPDGPG